MSVVPPKWRVKFEEAGWRAGRSVPVDPRVPPGHPAHAVLAELGGLELNVMYGDYEVCEASFMYMARIDRMVERWASALGRHLVGIAEEHNGHGELVLSETGQVFVNSYMHDAFALQGRSFSEAIDNLLSGKHARPMLLPNESSVEIYGIVYTHADQEVLRPSSPELR